MAQLPKNSALDIIANAIRRVSSRLDQIERQLSADPPADQKVEKIAARLAAKLSVLEKGDKGDSPTEDDLRAIIEPLIPAPIKGDNYVLTEKDKKDIAKGISVPIVDRVVERTEVIREQPIVTEITKEVAVADTADNIRNKLELLEGADRLDISAIRGIEERFQQESTKYANHGTGPSIRIHSIDLSSQCDGVTKAFKVPLNFGFIGLFSTSFPNIFRPLIDYTGEGTRTLTLTSQVAAPQAGQTLVLQYMRFGP